MPPLFKGTINNAESSVAQSDYPLPYLKGESPNPKLCSRWFMLAYAADYELQYNTYASSNYEGEMAQ
jgi:hypothetical protein